eukprot:symbB.v1.2.010590.t1/scaffold686.1/size316167/9
MLDALVKEFEDYLTNEGGAKAPMPTVEPPCFGTKLKQTTWSSQLRRRCAQIFMAVVPVLSWNTSLPRLVHFTRPDQPKKAGVGTFPVLIWEVALRSWQRFFPRSQGFRLQVWRDRNLTECMEQEFPEFLQDFLALPGGIERSDIGRYCILHQQGGIYADLDYEARANFFGELPSDLVSLVECRSKDEGLAVENSLMASPVHHPFWRPGTSFAFLNARGMKVLKYHF